MQYNFDKQMEKPLPKWTCLFKKNNNSIIYFRIKVVMNRFKITLGNKGLHPWFIMKALNFSKLIVRIKYFNGLILIRSKLNNYVIKRVSNLSRSVGRKKKV